MKQALLVIDVQNDYFKGGLHELYQTDSTLERCLNEIETAQRNHQLIIVIQHINTLPAAQFFKPNSPGAENHHRIQAMLTRNQEIPLIIKHKRNSFLGTELADILAAHHITDLKICGMKTDWCITCTTKEAISRGFSTTVIEPACTTLDQKTHNQAILELRANGATIEY